MKLLKNIPKKLFKSKRSTPGNSSFSSGASSDSSDFRKQATGPPTPTSVLPPSHFNSLEKYDTVNVNELLLVLSRVGAEPMSEDEIKVMLSEVDRDRDGCITLEDLNCVGSVDGDGDGDSSNELLRDAFDFFDTDRDGKITAEELHEALRGIGDAGCTLEECRRMIREVDSNGVGFVCFEDFTRMMMMQQQQQLRT